MSYEWTCKEVVFYGGTKPQVDVDDLADVLNEFELEGYEVWDVKFLQGNDTNFPSAKVLARKPRVDK